MADHPLFAGAYDRLLGPLERAGLRERRRRLLAGARGRVLEVGGGTGLNLPHYPVSVDQVVVLEPDGAMRRRMAARAAEATVLVEVRPEGIDTQSLPDGGFDTVVCVLVLCTVPDLERALAQVGRLLADGGTLLFLEHVGSVGLRGRLQGLVTPVWRRVAAGCHLDRNAPAAIRSAGLAITEIERFRLPLPTPLGLAAVQGVARPRRHSPTDFRSRLASPREGDHGGPASATAAEVAPA